MRDRALRIVAFFIIVSVFLVACGSSSSGGGASGGGGSSGGATTTGGSGTSGGSGSGSSGGGGSGGTSGSSSGATTSSSSTSGASAATSSSSSSSSSSGGNGVVNVSISGGSGLTFAPFSGTPTESGTATINIALKDVTTIQSVVFTNDHTAESKTSEPTSLGTVSFQNPVDKQILSSSETSAFEALPGVNALTYRVRLANEPLVEGTYRQVLAFSRGAAAAAFTGFVIGKNDSSITSGTLSINVFLVGEDVSSAENRTDISTSLGVMQAIFSSVGISTNLKIFNSKEEVEPLPNTFFGNLFYLSESSRSDIQANAVNLFIGQTVSQGVINTGNLIGVAGGIPGPILASRRSAVAVSFLSHRGADGFFTADETRKFGETMAHEIGHYLGLLHPVELRRLGNGQIFYEEGDVLTDTGTCITKVECQATGISRNLMFPDAGDTSFAGQQTLSKQQQESLHLSIHVN